MKKRWMLSALLALPLTVAGVGYGLTRLSADQPQSSVGYTCPLTGEELPCPSCCPMNGR